MRSFLPVVLCAINLFAASAHGQGASIQTVRATAGTVLTFYSHTRLNPASANTLDALPKGTTLKVKLLESIDSSVDRDGLEFRGVLVAPLSAGNEVILHAGAEVHGLLVLLRSGKHPEGFRYELLFTSISENGKSYELTASLNPSFFDAAIPLPRSLTPATPQNEKEQSAKNAKVPANSN